MRSVSTKGNIERLATLLAWLVRLSRPRRRAYAALCFVVYALSFYPLFLIIGPTTAVVGMVTVVACGLLLGPWAGVATAAACLVVSSAWYVGLGYEVGNTLPRTLPAHVVYAFVGAVVGALRQVTLALRDERARVERSQALLVAAERTAKMGSWETNLVTMESLWSDGAFHNLGIEVGDETPSLENGLRRVHPDDRESFGGAIRASYAERRPTAHEFRVVHPNGQTRVISASISFVEAPDGMPRAMGIASDVTERRELEARLYLADRMASLGTLAGGVAHEINNPLAVVAANIDFVSGELLRAEGAKIQDVPGAQAALTEARDGTRRIATIVGDLRTFARTDAERLTRVDVNRICDAALGLARNELKHHATVVQIYDEVPPVMADDARLGQVLVNLLVNAAHSIKEGNVADHRIMVATRFTGGRVEIDVSDTGGGIAPEVRARIFDPFFTTKLPGIGMGLGLAICHGIVRRLGGDLTVAATEVGSGTTMRVSLPTAPGTSVPAPPFPASPKVPRVGQRARVLIVDDEALLLQAIRRSLGAHHDVELAGSGKLALELLATHRYDVILCDLLMPEVSGMDVHEALKLRAPDLGERMVFMTGGAFTARAQEFLDNIPNLRLEKPVSTAALGRLFSERAGADES